MKQAGFFDVEERLARLSGHGDQLEAFSRTVDFEACFRRSRLDVQSFGRYRARSTKAWPRAET
ncbi:hypothetical protein GOB83_12710 [Acetobacter fabarum]|nr:hypothetical protein [Acetobacter fabarum]